MAASKIHDLWTPDVVGTGFTAVPSILLERQDALGLDAVHINIILQLAFHWRERARLPFPGKKSLAKRMGVTPRTVQRRIAQLEASGFVERIRRHNGSGGNDSNAYSLDGLIEKLKPFAEEHRQQKQRHRAENEARLRRRRPKLEDSP